MRCQFTFVALSEICLLSGQQGKFMQTLLFLLGRIDLFFFLQQTLWFNIAGEVHVQAMRFPLYLMHIYTLPVRRLDTHSHLIIFYIVDSHGRHQNSELMHMELYSKQK